MICFVNILGSGRAQELHGCQWSGSKRKAEVNEKSQGSCWKSVAVFFIQLQQIKISNWVCLKPVFAWPTRKKSGRCWAAGWA